MNLSILAKEITLKEGGKVNLPIAQVKEVLKLTLQALARQPINDVLSTIIKYRNKK